MRQDIHIPGVPQVFRGEAPPGILLRPAPVPRRRDTRRHQGADARGQEGGARGVRRGTVGVVGIERVCDEVHT